MNIPLQKPANALDDMQHYNRLQKFAIKTVLAGIAMVAMLLMTLYQYYGG